jgi:transcriptional regulator with XRE-family HTH domain
MVNGFHLHFYADDMKRQPKKAHNGHGEGFPGRLLALAKERSLTPQALKRYESGVSQPTLDVIKRLAQALRVTSDYLLFGKNGRGQDEDLRLEFEAVSRFDPDAKKVEKQVLESMILQQEARRWSSGR